jgi:RimJ/RimL family protein N-acetyltransferase
MRVAEKAGFEREGTLRGRTLIRGVYSDMLMYALLAENSRPTAR